MQFGDTIRIAAPQEAVWAFLLDPTKVGSCGPGVESIKVIDDTTFQATVRVGIGQFRARFEVDLALTDIVPMDAATLQARGLAPGTAVDAQARMSLTPVDAGTTDVTWTATVDISGKLAAVGARLIEWTTNRLAGQTFDCIRSRLESGG